MAEAKEVFRKVSVRDLDGWFVRNNWFVLSRIERDDGSWDLEAISPSGQIVGFAGDKGELVDHWSPKPLNVEVVNDDDNPVVVTAKVWASE